MRLGAKMLDREAKDRKIRKRERGEKQKEEDTEVFSDRIQTINVLSQIFHMNTDKPLTMIPKV